MLKTLLFCSILILATPAHSLGYYPPIGAYSQAVGGIGLFNNNAFSAHHNASLIPDCKKAQFGLSVQNKFAIQSFNQSALCVIIPYKKSGYGFKYFSNSTTHSLFYMYDTSGTKLVQNNEFRNSICTFWCETTCDQGDTRVFDRARRRGITSACFRPLRLDKRE
jgi:hypothetical protein